MGVVQVPLVFLYLSAEEGEGREKEEKKVSFCQFCCLKRYNDNTNVPLRSGGWCRQSEQQQDEGGTEKSEHFWTREREDSTLYSIDTRETETFLFSLC